MIDSSVMAELLHSLNLTHLMNSHDVPPLLCCEFTPSNILRGTATHREDICTAARWIQRRYLRVCVLHVRVEDLDNPSRDLSDSTFHMHHSLTQTLS